MPRNQALFLVETVDAWAQWHGILSLPTPDWQEGYFADLSDDGDVSHVPCASFQLQLSCFCVEVQWMSKYSFLFECLLSNQKSLRRSIQQPFQHCLSLLRSHATYFLGVSIQLPCVHPLG
jgi:hypothetical protein